MLRQSFDINGYWQVVVYWNIDYHFFDDVELELETAGFTKAIIEEVKGAMISEEAKAVTCSHNHISIVLFNRHNSVSDYISSIVHEAEHIKQAMLRTYNVEDKGEAPAYTIGYIVKRMWEVFSRLL